MSSVVLAIPTLPPNISAALRWSTRSDRMISEPPEPRIISGDRVSSPDPRREATGGAEEPGEEMSRIWILSRDHCPQNTHRPSDFFNKVGLAYRRESEEQIFNSEKGEGEGRGSEGEIEAHSPLNKKKCLVCNFPSDSFINAPSRTSMRDGLQISGFLNRISASKKQKEQGKKKKKRGSIKPLCH